MRQQRSLRPSKRSLGQSSLSRFDHAMPIYLLQRRWQFPQHRSSSALPAALHLTLVESSNVRPSGHRCQTTREDKSRGVRGEGERKVIPNVKTVVTPLMTTLLILMNRGPCSKCHSDYATQKQSEHCVRQLPHHLVSV
jgi:hypothetical protein